MALLRVPVTKSKGGYVEIDTDAIPEAVFAEVVLQGLKVLANRGASKITKETYPNEEELKTAAVAQAEKQKAAILDGSIKLTGTKASASKVKGVVMTEARRLAREVVKDLMKKNGIKISHVKASEITAVANELIAQDPSFFEKAEANIKAREDIQTTGINIRDLIKEDPKLVAADEAKKAKEKADKPLSAKQAGKVKARAKPTAQPTA